MKIRKLKFTEHPILGSLELDFTNSNGNTIDTIIIAGENGVGKSALLNEIYNIYNNFSNLEGYGSYNVEVNVEVSQIDKHLFYLDLPDIDGSRIDWEITKLMSNYNVFYRNETGQFKINHHAEKTDGTIFRILNFQPIHLFRKALKITFSDVEINYTPQLISSVTANNIDNYFQQERSSINTSTEIVQLLIDIKALDDSDISNWVNENRGQVPPEELLNKRFKRFTNAFEYLFSDKKCKGIINDSGHKDIVFEEHGKEMSISQLSSGEKQIVFRGSYLLKNKESIKGGVILIDEPEISLHPTWQLKILDYYKKLFQDENGQQTSQIFVVTHSPFVIHNANRSNDKVIILKKKDDGTIEVSNKPEFYGWTKNQLIQEAFDIDLFTDDTPVVFLEGETDEKYFNKALQTYGIKTSIKFEWIGRTNNHNAEFTGDKALNQTKAFLLANSTLIKNKIILLYDSDTNKPDEDYGNVVIRKITANTKNVLYKKGVENLLELPDDFDKEFFYNNGQKIDEYGAESTIRTLNKMKLCDWICSLPNNELEPILVNVRACIEKVIADLAPTAPQNQ